MSKYSRLKKNVIVALISVMFACVLMGILGLKTYIWCFLLDHERQNVPLIDVPLIALCLVSAFYLGKKAFKEYKIGDFSLLFVIAIIDWIDMNYDVIWGISYNTQYVFLFQIYVFVIFFGNRMSLPRYRKDKQ